MRRITRAATARKCARSCHATAFAVDQPEIGLVDERRGLEAVARALSRHAAPRDAVKLPVDERNQPLEGALVAPPPFEKQPGDLRWLAR